MRQPLTDRQREIYDWCRDFLLLHQRMPTLREVGRAFDIGTPNGCKVNMDAITRKGWFERDKEDSVAPWKLAGVRVLLEDVG